MDLKERRGGGGGRGKKTEMDKWVRTCIHVTTVYNQAVYNWRTRQETINV